MLWNDWFIARKNVTKIKIYIYQIKKSHWKKKNKTRKEESSGINWILFFRMLDPTRVQFISQSVAVAFLSFALQRNIIQWINSVITLSCWKMNDIVNENIKEIHLFHKVSVVCHNFIRLIYGIFIVLFTFMCLGIFVSIFILASVSSISEEKKSFGKHFQLLSIHLMEMEIPNIDFDINNNWWTTFIFGFRKGRLVTHDTFNLLTFLGNVIA